MMAAAAANGYTFIFEEPREAYALSAGVSEIQNLNKAVIGSKYNSVSVAGVDSHARRSRQLVCASNNNRHAAGILGALVKYAHSPPAVRVHLSAELFVRNGPLSSTGEHRFTTSFGVRQLITYDMSSSAIRGSVT